MASEWMVNAERWNAVDKLPPDVARRAAQQTVTFLETVRDLAQAYLEGPDEKEPLHHVWDFSEMDGATLDFLLATIGEGEVRITLCGGEAKVGDTGVPGLWRVENGKAGAGSFVLARLPRCVTVLANTGLDAVPDVVNRGPDVFASPAIIEELRHQIREADFSVMPEDPVFAIELTRQPMSPGDRTALYSTLGRGKVDVELRGFSDSRIQQTAIRGLWHSTITNNIGKTLMESYVVAQIPPEVPIANEEFKDTVTKCGELIDWVSQDLERGVFGGTTA